MQRCEGGGAAREGAAAHILATTVKSGCTYWQAAVYLVSTDLAVLKPHSAPAVRPEKVPVAHAAARSSNTLSGRTCAPTGGVVAAAAAAVERRGPHQSGRS